MNPLSSSKYAAFGRKAASYDAHAFVQKDVAQWTAEWLPSAAADGTCLEFGAGTGLLTQHLCNRFGRVVASDLEAEMLHVCQERVHGVEHCIRDAWAEQVDDSSWDYIVSSSLLQWARDPIDSLINWRALLNDSGRMILGFFIAPSLVEMIQAMDDQGPVEWRELSQWQDIFQQSALEVVRIESKTNRYHYESALHFWKSLHGAGATVSQRMKPSAMLRFFRDYDAQFEDENGVYATWTFCRVELRAAN
jgi:malonyl-CoA O-methyltransferase